MTATSRLEGLFGGNAISECCIPQVADERAAALVRDTVAGSAGAYWEWYAYAVLRSYLLAAALSGADSSQILNWAMNPEDPCPAQVLKDHAANVPRDWIVTLEAGLPSAGGERATIFGTLLHAMHPGTQPYPVP
ncbi:hypothetical protein [Streptomyces arenae]|uniref:hypothetical protein n=1 Tax=Streptomyces arenae TaxID=29301 RepID=UPI002658DBE6|nr:hypothetical protein [Streptomyces arenae]MCG7202331.1 hypothetical protein [Streptomyces arenae]